MYRENAVGKDTARKVILNTVGDTLLLTRVFVA